MSNYTTREEEEEREEWERMHTHDRRVHHIQWVDQFDCLSVVVQIGSRLHQFHLTNAELTKCFKDAEERRQNK